MMHGRKNIKFETDVTHGARKVLTQYYYSHVHAHSEDKSNNTKDRTLLNTTAMYILTGCKINK